MPAVAVQHYRCLPVQLLHRLLDLGQRYIDRAGQGAAFMLAGVAHIDQLGASLHQVAGGIHGYSGLIHESLSGV